MEPRADHFPGMGLDNPLLFLYNLEHSFFSLKLKELPMFTCVTLRAPLACPASRLLSLAAVSHKCMKLFTLQPICAHSRHDVNHQKGPFSALRAILLSVGALNLDDNTFSMSLNVIIFMVNLHHLLSWEPTKNAFNVARTGSIAARLLPGSCLPSSAKEFKCGRMWGFHSLSTVLSRR